jgi:hypothetical protein
MTRSKNAKCDKVKFFMRLLVIRGYIEKTPSNQNNFELYCNWAGGNIVRVGKKVLCISKALVVSSVS